MLMNTEYIIQTEKFKALITVDRHGDVIYQPRVLAQFHKKPFQELKKHCLVRYLKCDIKEVNENE